MESDFYGSMLNLSLEGKSFSFTVGETAHQQIVARLNIPFRYFSFPTAIVVWTIWSCARLFCLSSTR